MISTRSGDDTVQAGLGSDYIEGGSGDDHLIGDTPDATYSVTDLITMQEDRDVTVTFDYEGAGYRNTFGFYKVDSETGEIYDAGVIWPNASLQGSGGDLIGGVSSATIEAQAGDQIGFFIIGNGFSANDFASMEGGSFEFRGADGGAALISGGAPELYFVAADGSETQLNNPIYHTAAHGDRIDLNPDGILHTVGLLDTQAGQIQLGFEDLYGGGDKDYDDAVFTVDIGEATATVLNAHFQQNLADQTEAVEVINQQSNMNPHDTADRIHGEQGSDTLEGMQGNDLLVGDRAGAEWRLVDGEWVYDESLQQSGGEQDTYDDTLIGGTGNDVLNAGLGNDYLSGGDGFDRLNAGEGDDTAFGGLGDDQINLEDGRDVGTGGLGADTIHAGAGDDVVYGDLGNVLDNGDYGADPHAGIGFSFLGQEGGWTGGEASTDDANIQTRSVTQNIQTSAGEAYSMNFDAALSSLAAQGAATLEVYWNGELVETFSPDGALMEHFNLSVIGTGGADQLEIREVIDLDGMATGQDVFTVETELTTNVETITVNAFAPGQANLYQVISGEFFRFDTETQTYETIGDGLGFNVNAAGFNEANNLIYGFASNDGRDSNGAAVSKQDVIAIDADGNIYKVAETDLGEYTGDHSVFVGDFGPDGALYTARGGGDIYKFDVNNVSDDGTVSAEVIQVPGGVNGFADWAWVDSQQAFVAVARNGTIHKIDPFNLTDGKATVSSVKIDTTLVDGEAANGVPNGTWGAVFTDADGNLYAGLNDGDHDFDPNTPNSGGIYQITNFTEGPAQAVLLADARSTGNNDGISDPRSISSFAETDGDASVLIKNVTLTGNSGDNDLITGGTGDDLLYGEGGDDTLHGQEGDDTMDGGVGNDVLFGEGGDDFIYGGEGDDHIEGGTGDDTLAGNTGADTVMAGAGDDRLDGGEGSDKVVGGAGEDVIEGGRGDDHMWGGEWSADGETDTFVFSPGSGQDMIHDFESGNDVIDLSAYGLSWDDLQPAIQDHGWAVSIELGAVGGEAGDRIFLTNVSSDDLSAENFDFGG